MTIKKYASGQVVSGSLTGSALDWSESGKVKSDQTPVGLHIEGDAVISIPDWEEFVNDVNEIIKEEARK